MTRNPKQARAAIKRCCAAGQRADHVSMEAANGASMADVFQPTRQGPVIARPCPRLQVMKNRRLHRLRGQRHPDQAIPQQRANQLLNAAQVALAIFHCEPKSQKSA